MRSSVPKGKVEDDKSSHNSNSDVDGSGSSDDNSSDDDGNSSDEEIVDDVEDDDHSASVDDEAIDDADEDINAPFGLDSIVKVTQHAVTMRKTPGKSTVKVDSVPKGIQPITSSSIVFYFLFNTHHASSSE